MKSFIDNDLSNKYSWESNTKLSYESIQEDNDGNITLLNAATLTDRDRLVHRQAKARRITSSIRRGLIRYVVIGIDCSLSALEKDYNFRPNKLSAIKSSMNQFIKNYFDQNPISQLCITRTVDRIAEKLTELSGNPKYHENCIGLLSETSSSVAANSGLNINGNSNRYCEGEASLQNLIHMSMNILKHIPKYGHREVLIVYNSLKTRDPGDIFKTIAEAQKLNIRISIISLSAELYICKKICQDTGGSYGVAMDSHHLQFLLSAHYSPPPTASTDTTGTSGTHHTTAADDDDDHLKTEFIYMGFPTRHLSSHSVYGYSGNDINLLSCSYICPRCFNKVSELPTQCNICRLQLTSSSHIARSYHHLFPIQNFSEIDLNEIQTSSDTSSSTTRVSMSKQTVTDTTDTVNDNNVDKIVSSTTSATATVKSDKPSDTSFVFKKHMLAGGSGSGTDDKSGSSSGSDRPVQQCAGCREVFPTTSTSSGNNNPATGVVSDPTTTTAAAAVNAASGFALQCPLCKSLFCMDCDLFIHDSLHNCPGCSCL